MSPSGVARPRTTRAPCAAAWRGERPDRELGAQHAGLGLEQHELEVLAAEAREQAAAVLDAEPVDRDALRAHRLLGGRLPAVARGARTTRARTRSGGPRRTRPRARATACGRGAPTPCSPASAPWPQRISRVSPPEVARRSPGSNWSTSVTCTPSRASHHASEAPNVPAPTITTESMRRDATVPRVHALLAAAALLFGHSAEHRPLTATRVGEGPVKVLVVGSIHGNETAGRAVLAAAPARAAARRASSCGWCDSANPDGVRARHAPERPRGRPQPQLRPPLARRRAAVRHLLPGPARVLRAGVAGGAAARAADPARGHRLLPPAPAAREPVRRRRRADRARLRAPRRAARAHPAELPRHRDELAEPPLPGHERVRGRAAGRAARRRRRRGATRAAVLAAGRGRGGRRRRLPPADRVAQDPLRRRPPRPDARATRAATTASTPPRCATRR